MNEKQKDLAVVVYKQSLIKALREALRCGQELNRIERMTNYEQYLMSAVKAHINHYETRNKET